MSTVTSLLKILRNPSSIIYSVSYYRIKTFSSLPLSTAKSFQSCPTLWDPIDGSPPGFLSLGFSRQEHWSGLPFPSPVHESEKWKWSHSVLSDSSDPMDWLQSTRLLHPWDFPGKSTGVGCHCWVLLINVLFSFGLFFFFNLFWIEGKLLYSVVLVSAIQQYKSAIIFFFFLVTHITLTNLCIFFGDITFTIWGFLQDLTMLIYVATVYFFVLLYIIQLYKWLPRWR